MSDSKAHPERLGVHGPNEGQEEQLPPYQDGIPGAQDNQAQSLTTSPPPPSNAPQQQTEKWRQAQGPTVSQPFNFPTDTPAPAYHTGTSSSPPSSSTPNHRPIAIPQTKPYNAAPFLPAYAPTLLAHGITPETFRSFLDTTSAFLTAKVSDRAISHAGDIARQVGGPPKRLAQGVAAHARHIGHGIRDHARSGNYFGAAMGVVGGAISLPVGTALRTVGAAVSLPITAVSAVAHRPQTPLERVVAYAAVANKEWFNARGLHAQVLRAGELAALVGVPVERIIGSSQEHDGKAPAQLAALGDCVDGLEIQSGTALELGEKTLWLVLVQENRASTDS